MMILDTTDRQGSQVSSRTKKLPPGNNHKELLEEMKKLARLPMERRMAIAKDRRREQLQWFYALENEEKLKVNNKDGGRIGSKKRSKKVNVESISLLFSLVSDGDVEGVRNLIRTNERLKDVVNCHGMTALHQSCVNRNLGMIHVLVKELSVDVSKPDLELWTPLHTAALLGYADVAKFLLDNGADPLSLNIDLNMPYDICDDAQNTLNIIEMHMVDRGVTQEKIEQLRMSNELKMLKELKDAFNNDNSLMQKGPNNETLLHVAASLGYKEVTKFLVSNTSIAIDDLDNDGWQAIHCAAYWNQLSVVEVLIEQGASIYNKTSDNETALDLCRDETMKEWMQQKSAQDNQQVVKKASCVRRDTRRSSIQDLHGSNHFDSLVSLTELNKFSHSSKRLNVEMKEAKKKKDVEHEFKSLMTSESDPSYDCDSSAPSTPTKSSPTPTKSSPSPLLSPLILTTHASSLPIEIPGSHMAKIRRDIVRSHSSLNECSKSSSSINTNNQTSPRPQSSYISVYNNHIDHYTQLDSPSIKSKQLSTKQLLRLSSESCNPSPKSRSSTPIDKLMFIFPSPSDTTGLVSHNCKVNKNQISKDRPSSKKNRTSTIKNIQNFFSQVDGSERSQRTGSLIPPTKVETFEVPKRVNSTSDVARFSGGQVYPGNPDKADHHMKGKRNTKKSKNQIQSNDNSKKAGKCLIS